MYRSTSYASQGTKSAFVEMAERSAKTARLLQGARAAQPARPPQQPRSLARRAVSLSGQLLNRLGKRTTQLQAETSG
jgi:hypothetical protein